MSTRYTITLANCRNFGAAPANPWSSFRRAARLVRVDPLATFGARGAALLFPDASPTFIPVYLAQPRRGAMHAAIEAGRGLYADRRGSDTYRSSATV
jgi:hypothetical protein